MSVLVHFTVSLNHGGKFQLHSDQLVSVVKLSIPIFKTCSLLCPLLEVGGRFLLFIETFQMKKYIAIMI